MSSLIRTAAILLICIVAMQYLHELGHALVSKALGYEVLLTVNKVHSTGLNDQAPLWHSQLIAMGGPLVTIALSLLAFCARKRLPELAIIVVFNAMMMRMIAAAVSFSHPNDEAWVSTSLGLGMWALPLLVCTLLLGLFLFVLREQRPPWTWYLGAWIGVSIGYSLVVFGEGSLPQISF